MIIIKAEYQMFCFPTNNLHTLLGFHWHTVFKVKRCLGVKIHHCTQPKHPPAAWLNIYPLQLSNSHYRLSQLYPPVCGGKEKKTANNLGFLEKDCVYIVVARRMMFECSLSRSWVLVVWCIISFLRVWALQQYVIRLPLCRCVKGSQGHYTVFIFKRPIM